MKENWRWACHFFIGLLTELIFLIRFGCYSTIKQSKYCVIQPTAKFWLTTKSSHVSTRSSNANIRLVLSFERTMTFERDEPSNVLKRCLIIDGLDFMDN